jgi:hypothetical protein
VSKLIEHLYPLPDYRRSPLTLLRWWESRRLFFNRAVGMAGLVTLGGVELLSAMPPHGMAIPLLPLVAISVAYGVAANLFYTLGWAAEVVARWLWGSNAPELGPLLFRQGLIFSVGLTLFPLMLAMLLWAARVLIALAG